MTRRDPPAPPLPGLGGDGEPRRRGRMRRAADAQIVATRAMGAESPVDAGLIGLARVLADTVDAETARPDPSAYSIARVATELRAVLLVLRGERDDPAGDADYDAELAALIAAIRDAERSGTPDAGPRDPGPSDPAPP